MQCKTSDDYHQLAQTNGIRWLGPVVANIRTKTAWECHRGHCWQTTYRTIARGHGCPVCASVARRHSPADYHRLAQQRGLRWLGPQVSDTSAKTGWRCSRGHQWQADYSHIQQGSGCPQCASTRPKTAGDYHQVAKARNFRWLGTEAPNVRMKTRWQCPQGHQWEALYNNVRRGSGCPICANRVPKAAEAYQALAQARGFRWLGPAVGNTMTKTGWACPEGHEWQTTYNRVRRGQGCPFCANRVPKQPEDYHALAKERGFRWLGPVVANTSTPTGWACEHGHQWQARYSDIGRGSGCPVCTNHMPKTPADYHALAQGRGFRWLGPEAPDTMTRTGWQCVHGHRWQTTYGKILQGRGCPVCAGTSPRLPADYEALAEKRGFRWLGPTVPKTDTKTNWQCPHGHQWPTTYGKIRAGRGCPHCSNHVPKTAEDYHQLAKERGFLWLGPLPQNTHMKTWWQCQPGRLGHRWPARYQSIQQGTGCPVCAGKKEPEWPGFAQPGPGNGVNTQAG